MDIELFSSPCSDPGTYACPEGEAAPKQSRAALAQSAGTHPRRVWPAMLRGASGKCPNCGKGSIFSGYLKVVDSCAGCGQELHHHRADDAPPYFTIFIAGHLIIPSMILVEKLWTPALWIHMSIWLPLTLIMCMALLPPIKGALVGLQWALLMHGFAAEDVAAPHATSMDTTAP